MNDTPYVAAVNGSPHQGIGNTFAMVEMLREPLRDQGFELEQICLEEAAVESCKGCGLCMEKGKCWIADDHRRITARLLAADGIVLASPVYFMNVTGQTKIFLDRCLALGHKPRPSWKPGLAVSVSAGFGETDVARYLESMLRVFGAFSVGAFTAMATGPGEFWGQESVEARARDLARGLGRAIREKRRQPPTDLDLRFYRFMGDLVRANRETVMQDDDRHWEHHGLYDGFENYIRQAPPVPTRDMETRDAWIQDLIETHRAGRARGEKRETVARGPGPAGTLRDLLAAMPLAFDPGAAGDLSAVYQFEISGSEVFTAHVRIADGACSHHEGAAADPDVVVKAPAEVWLAISSGRRDGQRAFMEGAYSVDGDLGLLMKLRTLFPG